MTIYPRIVEGICKGSLEKLTLVQWEESSFEHFDGEDFETFCIDEFVEILPIEQSSNPEVKILTDQDYMGTPYVEMETEFDSIVGFYYENSLQEVEESREFHFQKYLVYKALAEHFSRKEWDYGDPEPIGVKAVYSKNPMYETASLVFSKSDSIDDNWSLYMGGEFKRKIDWIEITRRFGPVWEHKID